MKQIETHAKWVEDDVILRLRVTPGSSADQVLEVMGDRLKIAITAAPVNNKANKHLLKFLSQQFNIAKSQICIVSGETDRDKTVRVAAPARLPDNFLIPATHDSTDDE